MSRSEGLDLSIPPPNCLKAMAERVAGEDPVDARFCRYSKIVTPLVLKGAEVETVCLEECPHKANFGLDDEKRVRVSDASFGNEL